MLSEEWPDVTTNEDMRRAQATEGGRRPSGAQIIVETCFAALAIGSLIVFGLREMSILDEERRRLADLTGLIVCALFWCKAAWDLYRSPSKQGWFRWGWADLVASIPDLDPLRPLRALRLVMMIRVIRSTTRGVHGIATYFNIDRSRAVVATIFSLIVISVLTSSFVVLGLESGAPEANILTAEDALTWSVATLFGADFGDHQTVTTGGMLVSLWLVVLSLGLIGSLAGLISAWIERESDDGVTP